MGLDLSLLPFDADGDISFSHTILNCERRQELFEQLFQLDEAGQKVPEKFNSYLSRDEKYEDSHYGLTTKTPYGEDLKYVKAVHLKAYASHPEVQDNYINRAIWAYLACLPDETKVALYWH